MEPIAVIDFETTGMTPGEACRATEIGVAVWDDELARVGRTRCQPFACSMLLARRLLPEAPNHKLGTLGAWAGLPDTGRAHRAPADAEMAANLIGFLAKRLRGTHARVSHRLLCELQRVPAAKLHDFSAANEPPERAPPCRQRGRSSSA